MPHVIRVIACVFAWLLSAAPAWSLGFGHVSDGSVLGGPLDFSVALRLEPGEVLGSDCVSAEVLVGESRVAPSQVHVFLQRGSDGSVQAVRVRTDTRVDEPVATITLKMGCPARLARQFVAFLDPPDVGDSAAPAAAALQDVPHDASMAAQFRAAAAATKPAGNAAGGTEIAEGPAASAATRRGNAPATRPQRAAPRSSAAEKNTGTSKAAAPRRERSPTAAPQVAARPADGASRAAPSTRGAPRPPAPPAQGSTSRLSLDPPAASSSRAAASAAPGAAQAASAPAQPAPERALAELRLEALEASFKKLQAENEASRARMLTLQARVLQAESARYANPLVYALLVLLLLMVAAVVFLLKRQRRLNRQPSWLAASVAPSSQADSSWQSRFDDPLPVMTPQDVWPSQPAPLSRSKPGAAASSSPAAAAPATAPMPLNAGAPDAATSLSLEAPRRPVAVEELIDLEQQAEFFRVLGQEQSAIDLLMGHLRESGAGSPMPYLKLLDIHRRRGDRDDYERIRTRFNERFSAYAPEWGADLGAGKSLESYPEVVAELQRLWLDPKQAMARLETLMFRHDVADTTFELPAYLQLLFLFSVARDLAESEIDPSKVDLLLPIAME
jgi:pilus assembly protein FimV